MMFCPRHKAVVLVSCDKFHQYHSLCQSIITQESIKKYTTNHLMLARTVYIIPLLLFPLSGNNEYLYTAVSFIIVNLYIRLTFLIVLHEQRLACLHVGERDRRTEGQMERADRQMGRQIHRETTDRQIHRQTGAICVEQRSVNRQSKLGSLTLCRYHTGLAYIILWKLTVSVFSSQCGQQGGTHQ